MCTIINIRKINTNKERVVVMFNVNIVKCETEEVVESFEQLSRRSAEKLSRGISINLNHEEFYVDIIEK